jgi:uncharacterized protein YbjT (DUF2867 family)
MGRTAVIFGGTGLIGRACLEMLTAASDWDRVVAIGRTATGMASAKVVDLARSLDQIDGLGLADTGPVSDVFCCLGTTQAKAGTARAFQAVDRDGPIAIAAFAARAGAKHLLAVTAIGANARSPVLYSRTKGEAEAGLCAVADRLRVSIFRPSLLTGERGEFRWKEKLSEPALTVLAPIMVGPLAKYRPIAASTVAAAMIRVAREVSECRGVATFESHVIAELGRG